MNHDKAFIQGWNTFGGKGVGGINGRYALEVNVRTGKLRRNVIDVIVH